MTLPTITGKILPDWYRTAVQRILTAAGLNGCRCTSYARDENQQAVAMYDNCIKTGAAKQYGIYLDAGDQIIRVFEQNQGKPRDVVVKLMAQRIREIGGEKVTHHFQPTGSNLGVADFAQNSIANHGAFLAAARADPQFAKVLVENDVFHLELYKAAPAVQST